MKRGKTELVRLFDTLAAGPWKPEWGWDDPDMRENCKIVLEKGGFASKNGPLACVAMELLRQRQPDTVRGVMYAVASAGWLPDTSRKSYMKIQRILDVLRKRNAIPYTWIVDNLRSTEKPSSWSGLNDYANSVARWYRKDFWASLPDYVCIIVEKDTVAGRISPTTREYDVPLHPLRGFSSTSFAFSIADQWRRIPKPIHAYYIGDHDPSGRDIERSIRERLTELSGKEFTWTRLAVEPRHFAQFKIIPLEPKRKDSRYEKFIREYGEKCAEVEAVPADALREMVKVAIESHVPAAEWARLREVEALEKQSWSEAMAGIRKAAI